jgi:xanthine dehydrogenase molybdenum-binding subunit
VQVQLGDTEIGQGADTVFAQMTAETLGIPWQKVHVISTQDTDITPFGLGAYGSRQTYVGGAAINKVALMLKEKILKFAALYTQIPAAELDIVNGDIVNSAHKGKKIVSLEELAIDTLYHTEHSEHLAAEATMQVKSNAFSLGCAFAEVEVDIPVCKIKLLEMVNCHDCGMLINPKMAEGQVHGGMSMAIGFGMFEKMLYDAKTGKLLNGNLLDYKLPTIMDHPRLAAEFIQNREPSSPYGTKALGEPPTVPGAPAIRNAVLHATGVAFNTIPLTPHSLFVEFRKAGLI